MQKLGAVVFILHSFIFGCSLACNGYDISNIEVSKCDGSSEIFMLSNNFNMKFTKDCFAVTTGCVHYGGFNSAKIDITVKRGSKVVGERSEDLCESSIIGGKCPVKEGKFCFGNNNKVSIKPFRRIISTMAGRYEVDYIVRHDKATSCGKIKYRITKQ